MKFPKYDPAGSAPAAPPPSNRQGAASLRVSLAPGEGRLPPQSPPSWLGLSTWAALGAVLVAALPAPAAECCRQNRHGGASSCATALPPDGMINSAAELSSADLPYSSLPSLG